MNNRNKYHRQATVSFVSSKLALNERNIKKKQKGLLFAKYFWCSYLYVLVFRFSLRSKALLFKDWVCILLKKYDSLRLAHHGPQDLGHTRFPDLQTYQRSSMCIFCAVLRTKELYTLLRFNRDVVLLHFFSQKVRQVRELTNWRLAIDRQTNWHVDCLIDRSIDWMIG